VHNFIGPLGRSVFCRWSAAERRDHLDLAAQCFLVELESLGTVPIEKKVRVYIHLFSPLNSKTTNYCLLFAKP
jgi:hypothetical protein